MQRRTSARLRRPWLEHELARPNFAVMQRERERKAMWQIGPLQLNLRIDRVDETGGTVGSGIAYKTGRVSTSDWVVVEA